MSLDKFRIEKDFTELLKDAIKLAKAFCYCGEPFQEGKCEGCVFLQKWNRECEQTDK